MQPMSDVNFLLVSTVVLLKRSEQVWLKTTSINFCQETCNTLESCKGTLFTPIAVHPQRYIFLAHSLLLTFIPPSSLVTTKRTSESRSNPTGTDIDPHSVKMYHWLFLNVEDGAWPYVVKGMGIKISADGCFSAAEALR